MLCWPQSIVSLVIYKHIQVTMLLVVVTDADDRFTVVVKFHAWREELPTLCFVGPEHEHSDCLT